MISRSDAAKRLLALKEAEESFLGYVRLQHPEFDLQPFQLTLIDTLDRLERGTLTNEAGNKVTRVLVTMPPRHGKSQITTQLFPSYYMGRDPRRHVLSTAYSQDLSDTFGQKVRNYTTSPDHAAAFPRFAIRQDTRAKSDWMTLEDADHDGGGSYFATSIGGSTTGRPANLLIIDDPVKNRQEAESATYRSRVRDFYVSSLENRKEPTWRGEDPIEVVILTRWHPDDLAGFLMSTQDWAEGRWIHLNFPAIIETKVTRKVPRNLLPSDHPEYRPGLEGRRQSVTVTAVEESALWPDRFPIEELRRKRALNEREFAALYQQSPYIKGGNLVRSEWWQFYDQPPSDPAAVIISADTAFKTREINDPSAIGVWALSSGGDIYLLDVWKGRVEFPELKRKLIAVNAQWRGRGLRGTYIEDKASGQSLLQELRRESGVSVIPYRVVHDKVSRMNAVLPLIHGGRVYLPKEAPWLDDYLQEMVEFPSGAHDDQADMTSMALDVLSKMSLCDQGLINGPIEIGESLLASVGKAGASLRQMFGGRNPRRIGT